MLTTNSVSPSVRPSVTTHSEGSDAAAPTKAVANMASHSQGRPHDLTEGRNLVVMHFTASLVDTE